MNGRTFLSILALSLGLAIPVLGANPRTDATKPIAAVKPTPKSSTKTTKTPTAATPANTKTNPLLPPAIPVDSFLLDMSLVQKLPAVAPKGFDPLYTAADWEAYRTQFGTEAEKVTQLKSSAAAAFAEKLLADATGPERDSKAPPRTPGLQRLLILRAATIAYRNHDGFPVADKAIAAYFKLMDKKSATQVGALWTLANTMARTSVTPKEDRIRYDAIAARANMQLSLLLLDADQVAGAEAMIKQVAYHEGWLKKDPTTRGQIAQVRAEVKEQAALMDYLATQYQLAIRNDQKALTTLYLYGRYVKGNRTLVSQLPSRVPGGSLAELATKLDAAGPEKPQAAFAAAEALRSIATTIPDVLIRQRTLFAAIQLYDVYMASPLTERERVNRTLARIARAGAVSDGARKAHVIDPFASTSAADTMPATAPATQPAPHRSTSRPIPAARPESLDGTAEHPLG